VLFTLYDLSVQRRINKDHFLEGYSPAKNERFWGNFADPLTPLISSDTNGPLPTLATTSNAAARPVIAAIREERSILLADTSACGTKLPYATGVNASTETVRTHGAGVSMARKLFPSQPLKQV
jgi:hypothetical protein